MSSNVRINIENFRAIRKAEIKIDGITLIAGENGSGKSTLSKLLYFLYKTVSRYDDLVKEQLYRKLTRISFYIEILIQDSKIPIRDKREIREDLKKVLTDNEESDWLMLIDKLKRLYGNSNENIVVKNRMSLITKDVFGDDFYENSQINFDKIKEFITNSFKKAEGIISSRPISIFNDEIEKVFSGSKLPSKFEVLEFDDVIISLKRGDDKLSIPYTIRNSIYIDDDFCRK